MGSNSIRTNLSKSDIISDIRMSLSADLTHEKSVMVVEGHDDIQFWRNKISDNVYLYESFSGKVGVQEIINHFNKSRVIGICDQDYDVDTLHDYIFYYDFSCLEMMLVYADSAFKAFISEYDCGTDQENIRLNILKNLKWLSCLRKLNSINSWGIKFTGLSMSNIFNSTTTCFDVGKALTELSSINKDFHARHRSKLTNVTRLSTEDMSFCDLLALTNGHDFLCFLHCLYSFNKGAKGKTLGVDSLSASLRCSFRVTDFIHTTLYSKLKEFEQANEIVFLVA